ncbi:hypothetical protein B0T16DRAFT_410459 [Cercophora newfieldiana]|uniref:Uncharacterized protein n=1 Tax=Cercophora newfieldiana TaxID=92897 RepID=A0AA40CUM5_9PEZI|nr:hypothetical protein B0T16DRAFT_410459 [Cercophora newfieldiana]
MAETPILLNLNSPLNSSASHIPKHTSPAEHQRVTSIINRRSNLEHKGSHGSAEDDGARGTEGRSTGRDDGSRGRLGVRAGGLGHTSGPGGTDVRDRVVLPGSLGETASLDGAHGVGRDRDDSGLGVDGGRVGDGVDAVRVRGKGDLLGDGGERVDGGGDVGLGGVGHGVHASRELGLVLGGGVGRERDLGGLREGLEGAGDGVHTLRERSAGVAAPVVDGRGLLLLLNGADRGRDGHDLGDDDRSAVCVGAVGDGRGARGNSVGAGGIHGRRGRSQVVRETRGGEGEGSGQRAKEDKLVHHFEKSG